MKRHKLTAVLRLTKADFSQVASHFLVSRKLRLIYSVKYYRITRCGSLNLANDVLLFGPFSQELSHVVWMYAHWFLLLCSISIMLHILKKEREKLLK